MATQFSCQDRFRRQDCDAGPVGRSGPLMKRVRTHRSSDVVGLISVPVGVEHRADAVAPGVLVLQEDVGQADPRREQQVPQETGHKVFQRGIQNRTAGIRMFNGVRGF